MESFEEKYKKLEQKKARLQQTQARLKLAERKTKISRYIKLGQLIESANLGHLDDATLRGAFLSLKLSLDDANTLLEWKKIGEKIITKADTYPENAQLFEISFEKEIPSETKKLLRDQGFKFNSLRNVWEGKAIKNDLQSMLHGYNPICKEIKS